MKLRKIQTKHELASLLGVPTKHLAFVLYKIPDSNKYEEFEIKKKSGGVRTISKPCKALKDLQKKLLPLLEEEYVPKSCSYGFEKNINIKDNASNHLGKKILLNFDLSDFFGTINFGRVYGLFRSNPFDFGKESSAAIAKLVTYNNRLPQGSCTSPIIANMILRRFDSRMMHLCKTSKSTYTRFADDITISTTTSKLNRNIVKSCSKIPKTDIQLGDKLSKIVKEEGFNINLTKTRINTKSTRQEVTGLIVNEFVNVSRKYIRSIFGMIHCLKKYGLDVASEHYVLNYMKRPSSLSNNDLFTSVVMGRIGYIADIRGWHDPVVIRLCKKYVDCGVKTTNKILETSTMPSKYNVFIGHASEQKNDIAIPIYNELSSIGISSFIDIVEIKWGDSLTKKINRALGESDYFLAIISKDSIKKSWPDKEMNAAIAREISGKQKVLPLFVGSKSEINELLDHYALISDKLYYEWNDNAKDIAIKIKDLLTV